MAKVLVIKDRKYKLFSKSISVEGIASFFFFARAVEERDAYLLSQLIELGKQEKIDEIKNVLDI